VITLLSNLHGDVRFSSVLLKMFKITVLDLSTGGLDRNLHVAARAYRDL
jgi:hypothetical protein